MAKVEPPYTQAEVEEGVACMEAELHRAAVRKDGSMQALIDLVTENGRKNERHVFAPGQVFRMGPRYMGSGTYAVDNGCGDLVRLIRPMKDGFDWYVTRDLESPLSDVDWDSMVHVGRLRSSEYVGQVEVAFMCEGALYCPEHTVIDRDDLETSHVVPVKRGHEWLADGACCAGCGRVL